jgi:hypothetical protein
VLAHRVGELRAVGGQVLGAEHLGGQHLVGGVDVDRLGGRELDRALEREEGVDLGVVEHPGVGDVAEEESDLAGVGGDVVGVGHGFLLEVWWCQVGRASARGLDSPHLMDQRVRNPASSR